MDKIQIEKHIKTLKQYEKTLIYAAKNNGRGALTHDETLRLTRVYQSLCTEPMCFSCSRVWLWRLGVWFLEYIEAENSECSPAYHEKRCPSAVEDTNTLPNLTVSGDEKKQKKRTRS